MAKMIHFILFFLTTTISYGQVKLATGSVKSSSNSKPISDAHIFDDNGALQAVTDKNGFFDLRYEKSQNYIVTCLGFKTQYFDISHLLNDSVLYLVEDTIKLEEVIITPLNAKEIIERSIEHIDINYFEDQINKTGTISLTVLMDDSIVINSTDPNLDMIMRAPDYNPEIIKSNEFKEYKQQQDITDKLFEDLINEINKIFYFDHIIHKRGFLNDDNLDFWEFVISGYTVFNDMNVVIITANFLDNINNLNHTGLIYINEEDYGILKVDFSYSWFKKHYTKTEVDSLWTSDLKWEGRTNYLKTNDKYSLSNFEYVNKKMISIKNRLNRYEKFCNYEIRCRFTSKDIELVLP